MCWQRNYKIYPYIWNMMIGSKRKCSMRGQIFPKTKLDISKDQVLLSRVQATSALNFFDSVFADSLGSLLYFWRSSIIKNYIQLFSIETDFSIFQNILHLISNLYKVNFKQRQIKWQKCKRIFLIFLNMETSKWYVNYSSRECYCFISADF